MKKTILIPLMIVVSSLSLLTGCSTPEEAPIEGTTNIDSGRSFEDNSDNVDGEPDEDTFVGLTSSTKEGNKVSHDDMKSLLEAAAFNMEENKDKAGYMNEMYYQANNLNPAQLEFVAELSSSKSFCLRSTSREFPGLVMYYDSQIKSIVPDGKSCKAPLGTPWKDL